MRMSEVIHNYIQERGFIKNVIADRIGMERQKFYRIITGSQNLTVEEYELICTKGLEVDPTYFFKIKFSEIEKSTA